MKLIKRMMENSDHSAAKLFGNNAMLKGQLIDAKLLEIGMMSWLSQVWSNQQGRPNYLGAYPKYYNNSIFYNNPLQPEGFRRNTD